MGIAEGMKGLTADIVSSYDTRVKAIGGIVADTRKTIKGFTSDRKKMASEQAESLGNFARDLVQNVDDMLKGFGKARIPIAEEQARNLADFVKNLTKDVGTMMNGFKKEHKEMSEELKGRLVKEVKEIETYVTKLLKEFRASRSDPRVSEAYRKNFDKYIRGIISSVRGIANNTKQLIGEYHSDMSKARHAWQGMTATLAKAREKGVLAKIETGEKVATVAEATEKKKQKARKKKTIKIKG